MSEQPGNRVRASDSEREQVAAVLRDAMGEGRLTLTEGEERLAAVYAVTYRDELPALTADLPPTTPAAETTGPAGAAGGHRGRRRPHRPAGAGLVVVAAVLAGVWALAADGPIWPAILLGVLGISWLKRRRYTQHWARHTGTAGAGWPCCGRAPASRWQA